MRKLLSRNLAQFGSSSETSFQADLNPSLYPVPQRSIGIPTKPVETPNCGSNSLFPDFAEIDWSSVPECRGMRGELDFRGGPRLPADFQRTRDLIRRRTLLQRRPPSLQLDRIAPTRRLSPNQADKTSRRDSGFVVRSASNRGGSHIVAMQPSSFARRFRQFEHDPSTTR
jgi:hypothetical protein